MSVWIKAKGDDILISVHVQPGSSTDSVAGVRENSLVIKLCSPPVDGRANDSLIRFIARRLKVRPTSIQIVKGEKNRNKVLSVPGLSVEEAEKLLIP